MSDWRSGRELVFEIENVLRHMVRILVGTIVEIGLNKRPPEAWSACSVVEKRQEKRHPQQLHLLQVCYDNT